MKKYIAAFCVLLMMLCTVGCGKGLEGGQPEAEIISNDGIAVIQGDWVYFINGSMPALASEAVSDTPRAKIYRMRTDGSDCAPVTSQKAHAMHLYGDKIFYISPTRANVVLYSIGINGKNNKKLFTFNDSEYYVFGQNGIAIASNGRITYFDYETTTKKEFETGEFSGMRISPNYIYYYYQGESGTKRIEISSGREEILCSDNGPLLYVDDTEVYFVSARIPYRLNANTLELVQISTTLYRNALLNYKNAAIIGIASDEENKGLYLQPMTNTAGEAVGEGGNLPQIKLHLQEVSAYCINDDYIFLVEAETGDIYRMTYQGTEKTLLGKIQSVYDVDSMDVAGDMLYLFDSVESGLVYRTPIDGSGELSLIIK